eukprot:UN18967
MVQSYISFVGKTSDCILTWGTKALILKHKVKTFCDNYVNLCSMGIKGAFLFEITLLPTHLDLLCFGFFILY